MLDTLKKADGFTLIEVLVTLTLCGSLIGLTVLFGIAFYRSEGFYSQTRAMVHILETARANAQNGENGTAHGVRFFEDGYVLFSGNSYAVSAPSSRVFFTNVYPITISAQPFPEVIFTFRSATSADQVITVIDRARSSVSSLIKINYEGHIEF